MNGITIGSIIKYEREKKGIKKSELVSGVCTRQTLLRIEDDECGEDKLLIDILLQRLGKSPDKLEVVLPWQEYQRIRARDIINECVLKKRYERASYILEEYFSEYDEQDNIGKMFYYRTKAYITGRAEKDAVKALEYICEALDITLVGWRSKPLDKYLISTYEMENLLAYGKYLNMAGKTEEAISHVKKCLEYIEKHFGDEEELSKVYSKCVWLLASMADKEDISIIELSEKALELLRKQATGYFMVPLMRELMDRYERMGAKIKVEYWKKYYDILVGLYKEYTPDLILDSLYFNPYQCEYHLDYEIIRDERMAQGYSQWELVDGIFKNRETLSRIETGRSSPNGTSFKELMRALNIEKRRYNGFICAESFEILEMKSKLDYYLSTYKLDEADEQLKRIEERLDVNVKDNRLFVENIKNTLDRLHGRIDVNDALKKVEELLAETYDCENNNRVPMRNEALLIAQKAEAYSVMNRDSESIEILNKVLNRYYLSKVKSKYRNRSYGTIYTNYTGYYVEIDKYEEAVNLSKRGIENELHCGKLGGLSTFILIQGMKLLDAKENEKECKSLIKNAFFLDELGLHEYNCELESKFYEEHFKEPIVVL